jgi:hypothetical protein
MLNYAPIVISNNTGIDSDQLYFLGTGSNLDGTVQHFLLPDLSTGVCSYASPADYNSADPTISVKLSELPSSGENSYLIYIPQQSSGRCYLSVKYPLYLKTTSTTIAAPSVSTFTDPNFYTLYQNFELTLDVNYDLYSNVSNVDFYSIPMGLASFSYPSGDPYPTLDGLTASGFSETTTRSSILSAVGSGLILDDDSTTAEWDNLVIPFYSDPYVSEAPLTDLRILAAKNSIPFATNSFVGAAMPQGAFSSTYLQSSSSGPSASTTYMEQLYTYYQGTSTEITIYPKNEVAATYTINSSGTSGVLNLTAGSGAPQSLTVNLNDLTTIALLGGDVGVWCTDDVFGVGVPPDAWNTEISKMFSALWSAGLLPPKSTLQQPILDSDIYFSMYRSDYFTNPPTFTEHGPWWNLYDSLMHPLMIHTGGYGLGYAYDYDDLLGLGGEMHVNIQTAGVLNSAYPYYQMYAGPIDTAVPDPKVDFGPYNLVINSNASGSHEIIVEYSQNPGEAPSLQQVVPTSGSPVTLTGLYNYFLVTYSTLSPQVTYQVYPKYQLKLPVTTSYTAQDASLISNIGFVSVSGDGAEFTISITPP